MARSGRARARNRQAIRAYKDRMAAIEGERASIPNDPGFFFGSGYGSAGDDPFKAYLSSPFQNHPTVYAAVSALANAFMAAPFQLGTWTEDGTSFTPAENHPLDKLFRRPNGLCSGRQLWWLRMVHLCLVGESFLVLDREGSSDGSPVRAWLHPGGSKWTPTERVGPDGLPVGWSWRRGGEAVPIDATDVAYWRWPDPDNPLRGLPPLRPAALLLRTDMHADRHGMALYENGAAPAGVLSNEKVARLTDAQWDQMRQQWDDRYQGTAKAGKTAILVGGWKYNALGFSPQDIQYLEGRKFSREQLCGVLHLPKWMLSSIEDVNRSTSEETRASFWQDTMSPQYDLAVADLECQLFEREAPGLTARFLLDDVPAMRLARRARWTVAKSAQEAGITLAEANYQFDLGVRDIDDVPGAHTVYKPAGMATVAEDGSLVLSGGGDPLAMLGGFGGPRPPAAKDEPDEDDAADAEPQPTVASDVEAADEDTTVEAMKLPPMERARLLGYQSHALHRMLRAQGRKSSFAQRRALWRRWFAAVREPSEGMTERFMGGYFEEFAADMLKRFDKAAKDHRMAYWLGHSTRQVDPKFAGDALFDSAEWNGRLVSGLRPVSFEITQLAAAYTSGELGAWTEIDLMDNNVLGFLQKRMDLLSDKDGGIPARVRRQLAEQLQLGIAAGETIQELRARVSVMHDALVDPARTLRIARTEAGTLANGLRYAIAEDHVDAGEWVTAADEVVRDSHIADEQFSASTPVRIGQRYPNTGLLYPQEHGGAAGQVINCFLPGTMVEGAIVGGLEARYTGPAWEIETARGYRLRVTPNHPVLTAEGWRAAHKIREGDYLFSRTPGLKRRAGGHVDDQRGPSAIEDVFQSLSSNGGVRLAVISALDLHGDAIHVDDDIDRLVADDRVRHARVAGIGESLSEFSGVAFSAPKPSLPRAQSLNDALGGVLLASPRAPRATALALHGSAVTLESLPLRVFGVGPAATLDAVATQEARDHGTTDPEFLRDLILGSAGHVASDQVLRVRKIEWSGHVYDLQSTGGWILASGIVCSNCRCSLSLVPRIP